MEKKFSIEELTFNVPIKPELSKALPIPELQSRHAIAIVFSFVGFSAEVIDLLQNLNHKTRAYICNAKGLQGFLIKEPIFSALMSLKNPEEFNKVTKWHNVDMKLVFHSLRQLPTSEER